MYEDNYPESSPLLTRPKRHQSTPDDCLDGDEEDWSQFQWPLDLILGLDTPRRSTNREEQEETEADQPHFLLSSRPRPQSTSSGLRQMVSRPKPTTGIDTLRLFFPVRVHRAPDFYIIRHHQQLAQRFGESYLWQEPDGRLAHGIMAVRKVGGFRFRIAPVGTEIKLRAFFSAPNIAYGDNARTITKADLHAALEQMQTTLWKLGLEVDWREGQVSRVDVHRDVALPRPFHYYLCALHLIEPRYGRLFQNYQTGVLRGAATRLVYSMYDKRAEREYRRCPLPPETDSYPGWLRCEARLTTAAAVRERLGVTQAGQLVELFDDLSAWLDERIRYDLLNEELPEYMGYQGFQPPTVTPDDEEWWRCQVSGEAENFVDRLAFLGLRLAYQTIGPTRFWELAKEECRDAKLPVSKLRSRFRQVALASYSDEQLPIAHLYDELKQTLLNHPVPELGENIAN